MKRHIIVADLHGRFNLLMNVLEHSEFNRENGDELVIAGDWCDIGPDTRELWNYIKGGSFATLLLGNHEAAHIFGINIWPQDQTLRSSTLPGDWKHEFQEGRIKIAHSIGDIIITHAGVADMPELRAEPADVVAEMLNTADLAIWARMPMGPLWFRPFDNGMPLEVRQIAGHTPLGHYNETQQMELCRRDFMLIDPYARKFFGNDGYCMYAIVVEHDDGEVTMERVMVEGESFENVS